MLLCAIGTEQIGKFMSVNKAILIGRLGKDPEVRKMTNGDSVANVSLATSETYKDKSGQKQERTEWHNLVFYRRLAEIVGQYLTKGSQIYVEGRIQSRKWQTKEGQDRYTTEIIVHDMTMLGGKTSGQVSSQGAKIDDEFDIPFGDNAGNTTSWKDKDDPYPF